MTKREAQILEWIKENPLISQQEIANRASITRSSAAVHISNLMKKGKIAGKGYIVKDSGYITVVGAVNVDILGTSFQSLIAKDSNPGLVRYSFGGVGRNIADNLCRLSFPTELITVLGDDLYAQELKKQCYSLGIHLTHAMTLPNQSTSTYLCINDEHGEMQLAVSDMNIYKNLIADYLKTKMDVLNHSSLVVVDTNLSQEAIAYLLEQVTAPIFVDPVSTSKAEKLIPYLSRIHTIKPNLLEMQLLTNQEIQSDEDLDAAAQVLLDKGIKQIFVSLGSKGVYYANAEKRQHLPNLPSSLVNTTGCGDAFMAGTIYAYEQELDIEQQALYGLAAAAICAESSAAIAENLSPQLVEQRLLERGNLI